MRNIIDSFIQKNSKFLKANGTFIGTTIEWVDKPDNKVLICLGFRKDSTKEIITVIRRQNCLNNFVLTDDYKCFIQKFWYALPSQLVKDLPQIAETEKMLIEK